VLTLARIALIAIGGTIASISSIASSQIAVPFASGAWELRVISLRNPGTAKAVLTAKIAVEGAREYCDRDPGGETIENGGALTKRQCVEQLLAQEGSKILTFRANCPQHMIFDGNRWLRQTPRNRAGEVLWRGVRSRRILDGSGASNHYAHNEQLRMMCPGARTDD